MVGVLILSIVVSAGLAYFINTHTTQMIGFDPHEILGVAPEATINQIKKAYRYFFL
jgi:preprotein translocase subunit Sec63